MLVLRRRWRVNAVVDDLSSLVGRMSDVVVSSVVAVLVVIY